MQQEMGICRAPTTVLALMPLLPAEVAADPVASLVRAREVQWVVAQYAREMRETAAAPLEDYGVYLLTSTRNRVSPERQQEELVARAEELRRLVGKRCGLDATVGIGSSHEPGERLAGSYRAAIVALHVALTRGVRIQVARSAADDPTTLDDVRRVGQELRGSLLEHRAHELGAVLGRFCHSVVSVAGSHAELGRGCFELTLFELRDVARRELGMGAERAAEWVRDDLGSLGAARSIHEMVTVFRAAVTRLAAAIRGGVASDAARFSAVLAYVDERHAERLTLERVARATGYSVPTLTRTFKRVTGTSFLGYVVARRLEHARRLLRATDLTVERVAACSGFGSVQHFLRTFRRHDSCSPAEYRASERFRDGDSA
jgi:AraC-like DNA-binding protein